MTGILLFEALHASADRGVRVRLLLNDNNIYSELDAMLMALDAHPNIEVRLFNPFMIRKPRLIVYINDFSRLNRRIHRLVQFRPAFGRAEYRTGLRNR